MQTYETALMYTMDEYMGGAPKKHVQRSLAY